MNIRMIEHNNIKNIKTVSKFIIEIHKNIKMIKPDKNDILILSGELTQEELDNLYDTLNNYSPFKGFKILFLPSNIEFSSIDEKTMNKLGWYRKSKKKRN